MSKYQEALNIWKEDTDGFFDGKNNNQNEINVLQELVNKATPKKVDMTTDTLICPYCQTGRVYDWENDKAFSFCADCGQAIDWSTDE